VTWTPGSEARAVRPVARAALACAIAAALAACDNGDALPDWSRMITQPKLLPYGETALFADGRAMRPLPAGAIARDWIADPVLRTGHTATSSADVEDIPVPVTRALLERGRHRYAIVCATCHGTAGDGDSAVARNMQRRRPPSLHEARIAALAPGALYRVIASGYGLMPSYAKLVPPDDRWAVVAYVRTLQLSWTARLDALPPAIRDGVARRLQ
jgi:mono/diheme cytochrome c family protein